MKYDKEIAAHVIKNIALIESSIKVLANIENLLLKATDKFIEKQVKASDLKLGKDNLFNLMGDYDCYFSTEAWEAGAKEHCAWYHVGFHAVDEDDLYFLTHVLGESGQNTKLHLQFAISWSELDIKKNVFKTLLRNEFEKNVALHDTGFMLSEDGQRIELVFHLDKEQVAEEYPHFDECFAPLKQTLESVFEAHPIFEKIVENIKQQAETSK